MSLSRAELLNRLESQLSTCDDWTIANLLNSVEAWDTCVETRTDKCGGVPVLRGTRFTIAQILAELAESGSVTDLAENFDLNPDDVSKALHALSAALNRPSPQWQTSSSTRT